MYQKGDIVDVDLGTPPDQIKGHEQGYDRPCLIIKPFNTLKLAVVVPCTSKSPRSNIYTIVKLTKGSGGLATDSYILCHQVRTISFDRIKKKRGKIDNIEFSKVQVVLADMLEL